MTERNEVPTEMPFEPLEKRHVSMLWQLVNAPGVAAPLADAQTASELYAALRAAAVAHGVIES
jgi:hypothetical protein